MAMMPLVPETKMADVGKLISLGNLLVRKVTWLVLTTTSATLIFVPCIWSRLHDKDCLYILSSSKHSLSYIVISRDNTLSRTFWLPAVNSTKMYIFCNLFLSCPAFSVRLEHNHRNFVKSRKRQTTNIGEDTCLLAHVAIFLYIDTLHEILSPHTFYCRHDTFNI